MSSRSSLRLRSMLGVVCATLAAILFLKFSDSQSPYAMPSYLYRDSNDLLGTGLPWWAAMGAIIGLIIGLSLIRSERQVQQGFINITIAIALVASILSYIAFISTGYAITFSSYLLTSALNIILLIFVSILPAGATLVIVSMISSRPAKRSAWDIMPAELKAEMLRKQAQQKRLTWPTWLTRHRQQEP